MFVLQGGAMSSHTAIQIVLQQREAGITIWINNMETKRWGLIVCT